MDGMLQNYLSNLPGSAGGSQLTSFDPSSFFSGRNFGDLGMPSTEGNSACDCAHAQSAKGAHSLLGQYGMPGNPGAANVGSPPQANGEGSSPDFSMDADLGLPGEQRFVIKDGKPAIEFYDEDGQLLDSMDPAEFAQTIMDAASGDEAAVDRLNAIGADEWTQAFSKMGDMPAQGTSSPSAMGAGMPTDASYGPGHPSPTSGHAPSSSGLNGLTAEQLQQQLPEGKSVLRFNEDTQQWEVVTKDGIQTFDSAEDARAAHKAAGGDTNVDPTQFGGETSITTDEGTVNVLRDPLAGQGVMTSPFGMRSHPISGDYRMHNGVDYGADTGTPVYAATDGIVESAGVAGGYGNSIVLQSAENSAVDTTYNHLNDFAPGISEGAYVEKGQLIGYVGSTGNSTGPHLDYEVLVNGTPVDPLRDHGGVS